MPMSSLFLQHVCSGMFLGFLTCVAKSSINVYGQGTNTPSTVLLKSSELEKRLWTEYVQTVL